MENHTMSKNCAPHIIAVASLVIFIVLGLACASTQPSGGGGQAAPQPQPSGSGGQTAGGSGGAAQPDGGVQAIPTQAQTGGGGTRTAPATSPYFTGNGGRGMRLGILVPHSQGLDENQQYLPAMVQGILVSNISKYSGISVLDRVSLDRVIMETLDLTYEDDLDIVSLGHVAQVGHMLTGNIIRTSTGFSLQLNVTDTTAQANTVASYSGTCTAAELDDHSAIHRASLELLSQMNVQLTARARSELGRASAPEAVNAQAALARGVTAQRQGTEVAALSYFLQAAEIDPLLSEAETRLNNLTASITSGNMGASVQNDMQWRNQWIARLKETEEFLAQYLRESTAFYLVYPSSSAQWDVEYERDTITLGIELCSLPEPLWFESINRLTRTVRSGLLATGRADAWRLNWPAQSVTMPSPFADATNSYAVVVEVFNARGVRLGRGTVNLRFGWFIHNGMELTSTIMPYIQYGPTAKAAISGIAANAVTGDLTVRISTINGRPAESAASQMGIRVLPRHEYDTVPSIAENRTQLDNLRQYDISFTQNSNRLTGYRGGNASIAIPWGVTQINDSVFGNKGLVSVILPSSVLIIGQQAFIDNRLTSVIIPDGVTSIGDSAFRNNRLTSVYIPDDVTIRRSAFYDNGSLRNVTIGANVRIEDWSSFSGSFNNAYYDNSRRAGTYTYDNGSSWNYSPRR
jgi:hypothetical protein